MKKIYAVTLCLVFLVSVAFGFASLVDKDQQISEAENRGLKQKPAFTLASFFNGSYMEELDSYYTDQFPLRDSLMKLNSRLNQFYNYSSGSESGGILIDMTNNAGAGGIGGVQGQDTAQEPSGEDTTQQEPDTTTPTDDMTSAPDTTQPEQTPEEPVKEDPEFDNPENAATVNSMLVVGDRAMEIVYGSEDLEKKYAAAVNQLDQALGDNVKTYSIVVPNSVYFYGPEDLRSGSTDQLAMINTVYDNLDSKITAVDAYSKLRSHIDEYIYFRTDHHWTALGAYYAYTAFCEAAGLEAVPLDQYETGLVTNSSDGSTAFLGTLYSNVAKASAQYAEVLKNNPDTVSYYKPVVKTNAISYKSLENGELTGSYEGVSAVSPSVGTSYLYMAFLGGDQPIEIITTDVDNGKVCMVLKESYGNAFVPFLTSHYSKIVVVDPREFNNSEDPNLYLPDLAQKEGVTDLIVINYPYIPSNEYFITRLNRLATP